VQFAKNAKKNYISASVVDRLSVSRVQKPPNCFRTGAVERFSQKTVLRSGGAIPSNKFGAVKRKFQKISMFSEGENHLELPFLFHETKRGELVGICLFIKSGRTLRKIRGFPQESFLSDSILLKNEARWVKKASSAPNGGSLKNFACSMLSLSTISCASPKNNLI
jgi:hypothetical protein